MDPGSRNRASGDAVRHLLKRRLPNLDSSDHVRYIELECQRIVEILRVVRDHYRIYLKNAGCKPIAEMYWVVSRFVVTRYAVKILRRAASDYVVNSKIESADWQLLFGYPSPKTLVPMGSSPSYSLSFDDNSPEAMEKIISGLVRETTFARVMPGGPFGKEGQTLLARQRLDMNSRLSISEDIALRQELWDKCRPWTDSLATMFDVSQEEILFQLAELPEDARRAEAIFLTLTELEKIAYKHLIIVGGQRTARSLGETAWKNLFRELDGEKLSLDSELTGRSKEVLSASRKRKAPIATWSQCYDADSFVSIGLGRTSTLKREVMHFLHNAAKKAAYQISKIQKQN
jgi:hypothetical protein